jgi:hypothetical protein
MAMFINGLYRTNEKLKEQLSVTMSNQKAFMAENISLKDENKVFKFTIEQLNYYNDSILNKLNKVTKDLGIKNKSITQLQYLLSKAGKNDTIVFKDTIFKESVVNLDTTLGDKWYNINLKLYYPSTIITSPSFISEKYVIFSSKKETINPPKKWWILRLFQKKHTIVEVNVIEDNPYIKNKQQRFIEVIK